MVLNAGSIVVYRHFKDKNYTWRTFNVNHWCPFQSEHAASCNIFIGQNRQGLGCWQCQWTSSSFCSSVCFLWFSNVSVFVRIFCFWMFCLEHWFIGVDLVTSRIILTYQVCQLGGVWLLIYCTVFVRECILHIYIRKLVAWR